MKFLVFLGLIYLSHSSAQELLPQITETDITKSMCLNDLKKYYPSKFKETANSIDLREFSLVTSLHGVWAQVGISYEDFFSRSFKIYDLNRPWYSELLIFPEFREQYYQSYDSKFLESKSISIESQDRYSKILELEMTLKTDDIRLINKKAEFFRSTKTKSNLRSKAEYLALCGFYVSLLQINDCIKSLEQIVSDMSSAGLTPITLIDEVNAFLIDQKNYEAMKQLSVELDQLLRGLKPIEEGMNFFETVQRAYLQTGNSMDEAYENAWKFMGIYSTAGGNIDTRIEKFLTEASQEIKDNSKLILTNVLAAITLDSKLYFAGKKFFMYPSNIISGVNNAKAYHFWMSAYLARKTTKLYGSSKASEAAAWLSNIGYQMKSETAGRDPARAFKTEAFGFSNNKIRLDLAYSANGAKFGAASVESLSTKTYSVDQTLRVLLKEGEDLAPLSSNEATELVNSNGIEFWNRWNRIFAPKKAFDSVK